MTMTEETNYDTLTRTGLIERCKRLDAATIELQQALSENQQLCVALEEERDKLQSGIENELEDIRLETQVLKAAQRHITAHSQGDPRPDRRAYKGDRNMTNQPSNMGVPQYGSFYASREPAKMVLLNMIDVLNRKLSPLKILEKCISWDELSSEEEEGLWELFQSMRRELDEGLENAKLKEVGDAE